MPDFVETLVNLVGMIGTSVKNKEPFDWADSTSIGFRGIQTLTGGSDDFVEWAVGSSYTPTLEEMAGPKYFGAGIAGWATKCLKDTTIFAMKGKKLPLLKDDAAWVESVLDGQVPKKAIASGAYKWADFDLTGV